MSEKQLILVPKQPLSLTKKEPADFGVLPLTYSLIDPNHYSFTYQFDDTIHIRMDESAGEAHHNDFVDVEFEASIPEENRLYYKVAFASGSLIGALSLVKLSEERLSTIDQWKKNDWQKIVTYAAEVAGYKKKGYKGAADYLLNRAIRRINNDEVANEYLTILASHPTKAGLIFSLITQFYGKEISLNESGSISTKNLPKYYFVGKTSAEKIMAAVLYWLFNLAANQVESKRHILDELGLPLDLLKRIKAFVKLPVMQKIPEDYGQSEKAFSEWIEKVVSGTQMDTGKDDKINRLMKVAMDLSTDAMPVLINECVVRCSYILIRLCELSKAQNIHTFEEFKEISADEVLPKDDRILSHMCLIASAAFTGTNISAAALKALTSSKAGKREFMEAFLSEINIVGVGRFVVAVAADAKYWGDEVKLGFQRKAKQHTATTDSSEHRTTNSAFSALSLDAIQARILYCFENFAVLSDIAHTENEDVGNQKRLWLETWRKYIISGTCIPEEYENEYFVDNEDLLFDGIYELSKDRSNFSWFYLLTQELALFTPYFPLGSEDDAGFKKLKCQYDYVTDKFIRRQTIVSQGELDQTIKSYKKYTDQISGKTAMVITSAVGGTAVTAITGGLALTFAPGIAALIAGEAVVGLHGAALTSASLAFVGGGSLAAGGLGMAGGTAIITGGGALLGLVGSGGVSATAFMMATPSEYWVRQSAKLLTYSRCTLKDTLHDYDALDDLISDVSGAVQRTKTEMEEIKKEGNDLDKPYLKKLGEYGGYLEKVYAELKKLCK